MQTKTIATVLLIAIATIGAIAVGIGTATQSAHAFWGGPPFPSSQAVKHACNSGHPSANHAEICTG